MMVVSVCVCVDVPATPSRTATICGGYDECLRAKKMVEEMIAEVKPPAIYFSCSFFITTKWQQQKL